MSNPVCPICKSDLCQPDPTNGGAGRNRCMRCYHRAPVRDFHTPSSTIIRKCSVLDTPVPRTPPSEIRQYRDE